MGLFGKKKPKVVDWSERLARQQEQVENMREDFSPSQNSYSGYSSEESSSESSVAPFPFFAGTTSSENNSSDANSEGLSPEERRRKLGKRLLDMTDKIEELSNQIYKLEQRIETLERRSTRDY